MQMLTSIMCLVLPLASAHQGGGKKVCLTSTTATDLLTRYFAAWTSPDAASVPSLAANAVTSDFTYTDETLNFGVGPCVAPPEGPLVFSRDDFVGLLQITIGEATITDEKFEVLDVVVECEKLAVRWLGSGKAVGNVLPNMYVKCPFLTRYVLTYGTAPQSQVIQSAGRASSSCMSMYPIPNIHWSRVLSPAAIGSGSSTTPVRRLSFRNTTLERACVKMSFPVLTRMGSVLLHQHHQHLELEHALEVLQSVRAVGS